MTAIMSFQGLGDVFVAYPEFDKVVPLSHRHAWDFAKYCMSVKPIGEFADPEPLDLARLQPWLEYLMIVDFLPDIDNFRYRRYSRGISDISGFDMTGRLVSDFDSEVGRFFERLYRKCISEKVIIYSEHFRVHARHQCDWQRVLCPVRDGDKIYVVACNFPVLKPG